MSILDQHPFPDFAFPFTPVSNRLCPSGPTVGMGPTAQVAGPSGPDRRLHRTRTMGTYDAWGAAMKELVNQHRREPVDAGFDDCKPSPSGGLAIGDRCSTPTGTSSAGPAGNDQSAGRVTATDPLAELGPLLAAVAQRDSESTEAARGRAALERKFLDDFARACLQEIRPAMIAVLKRLQQLGGDGIIEEHAGGETRFRKPRITLWMSLKDEIVGEPRLDRHPYLLFPGGRGGGQRPRAGRGGGRSGAHPRPSN